VWTWKAPFSFWLPADINVTIHMYFVQGLTAQRDRTYNGLLPYHRVGTGSGVDGTFSFLELGETKNFFVADNVLVFMLNKWEKQ